MLVRVTGRVTHVERKSGENWFRDNVTVLVGERGIAIASIMGSSNGQAAVPVPSQGDQVDWLVEIEQSGKFLRSDVRGDFPANDLRAVAPSGDALASVGG